MLVMKSQPLGARSAARLPVFVWECVLVVTWLVVFGIFGKMFIGSYGRGDNVERMRHAVYLDLVVLVLFGGSGAWMGLRWWKGRREGDSGSNDGEKGLEMG